MIKLTSRKELIFKSQFTDRGGRTVFHIHERSGEKRYYSPGPMIGVARFIPGESESIEVEWLPEQESSDE
jgi:hypothetical protein